MGASIMGWLKRRIDNQYAIEYRGSEQPPILPGEIGLVEIIEADSLIKPAQQIADEQATLIADLKQLAKDLRTGNSAAAIFHRAELMLLKDELNELRAELRGLKSRGIAATNTQASIRGIFSPVGNLPDRTNANLRDGLQAKITADVGNLD